MTKPLCAGALLLAMSVPALAGEEYFVAVDTSLNQCRVMSIEPDGTAMKRIGNSSFPTLDEATEAMETLPECNN
jgi:hypothetical protein